MRPTPNSRRCGRARTGSLRGRFAPANTMSNMSQRPQTPAAIKEAKPLERRGRYTTLKALAAA